MRIKSVVWLAVLLIAGIAMIASANTAPAGNDARPDCPQQVACPLTGELVCLDQCPLPSTDQARETDTPVCCPRPR